MDKVFGVLLKYLDKAEEGVMLGEVEVEFAIDLGNVDNVKMLTLRGWGDGYNVEFTYCGMYFNIEGFIEASEGKKSIEIRKVGEWTQC